jgi:hypothetical protein
MSLPDKTIVDFWYKSSDCLLQHQINEIITATDLESIEHVELATGGDHGSGRFQMALKLLNQLVECLRLPRGYGGYCFG